MYQLVNVITCELTDQASPNSVYAFFMDFNETVHIYSLRGSNMCQTNYLKRTYYAPGGALVFLFYDKSRNKSHFCTFLKIYFGNFTETQ